MVSTPNSLSAWKATPEQEAAARLLAHGTTWQSTADQVHVEIRSIGRWMQRAEFRALVDELAGEWLTRLENQLEAGAQEMISLWRDMVAGRVPADDKRIDRVAPIVRHYYEAAIAWDDAPARDAQGGARMAVQVNVGGGRSAPE